MKLPRRCCFGLTGGIGSGKSTAAKYFAQLGASLVDADAISRALTAVGGTAIAPIRAQFGAQAIATDGSMDRAYMRERVFSQAETKKQLESILHPLIQNKMQEAIESAQGPYVLLDHPLLLESERWRERVDKVIVVDCPENLQITRVMSRSGISAEQVKAIMANQATRQFRLERADFVIDNQGDEGALREQVEGLHQTLLASVCYS